jgi:hypothetical protein
VEGVVGCDKHRKDSPVFWTFVGKIGVSARNLRGADSVANDSMCRDHVGAFGYWNAAIARVSPAFVLR